ncbi:methyltransferase domain-containing protein [Peribacillus sp. SCS-155]|uniref:methyltransferase domain-containing protein n=1 Tax=Peribacillus sedimenti TaxID=3115297 RepID=UPI0039067270
MAEFIEKYTKDYWLAEDPYKKKEGNRHTSEFISFIEEFITVLDQKDILEIGFGTGELIPYLINRKIASYSGIDFSEYAFSVASAKYTDARVELKLSEAKDLAEEDTYDVIVMDDVIQHIPVYEMESVWEGVKRALRPGGFIVLNTPLFTTPNVSDYTDGSFVTMGIHCNKQTKGTLLRTCIEHDFVLAKVKGNHFGLIRKADLSIFDEDLKDRYVRCHEQEILSLSFPVDNHPKPDTGFGRLVIGCVTENNQKFFDRTLRLVQSIRWFGGSISGANIIVCFVDEVNPVYVQELKKWGAIIRIVPRFSPLHPPSNKLEFLRLKEIKSYDTVMLLDCDTVIVQDPASFIDGNHLQAKMANGCSVSYETFVSLFDHYELKIPGQNYITSVKKQRTIWYCNAGVLIFPQPIIEEFFSIWEKYTNDLANKPYLMGESHYFCEQASLTLAFVKNPVPFKELTNQMNCPVREPDYDPVIIHYRNAVTEEGYLKIRKKNMGNFIKSRFEMFNERLRKHREEFGSTL